jgi:PAS domain S-box-containing protein
LIDGEQGQQVYTLQSADQPYRIFVQTMNEGAVTLAADGTIFYCNRQFAELVGLPLEQTLGISFRGLIGAGDEPSFDALLQQAVIGGSRTEIELLGASGAIIPVRLSAGLMPLDDGPRFLCLVVTDLRGQKLQARLAESKQRLRLAAQTSGFGIHDYDARQDVWVWTAELYALAGVPPAIPITGELIIGLIHSEDREDVRHAMRAALDPRGSGEFTREFRICRADTGEVRWFYNRSKPLFSGAGGDRFPLRNTGIIVDITERKRLEQELHQRVEDLREADRRKDEFLATLSHELRNPWRPFAMRRRY